MEPLCDLILDCFFYLNVANQLARVKPILRILYATKCD
jgi:hypothetical protein